MVRSVVIAIANLCFTRLVICSAEPIRISSMTRFVIGMMDSTSSSEAFSFVFECPSVLT